MALSRLFGALDQNTDGLLSLSEFYEVADHLACSTTPDEGEVAELFSLVDADRSGAVPWQEFSSAYSRLAKEVEAHSPEQLHLSVTNDPSQMVAMWVTFDRVDDAVVEYMLREEGDTQWAQAEVSTYTANVFGWDGWIYTAVLDELQHLGTYDYRVGSNSTADDTYWSEWASFRAWPRVGTPLSELPRPFKAFAFGDMGTVMPLGFKVCEAMDADLRSMDYEVDVAIHTGDVAYQGTKGDGSGFPFLEQVWDVFGRQIEPVASYVPWMIAVGNHEKYENYTAFQNRFTYPGYESGGESNLWYSFDYASIHFTLFDTDSDYSPGSPQLLWMEEDLRRARERSDVEWLIVANHRPMYTSTTRSWPNLVEWVEPLLRKYRVHLNMAGHMHSYDRPYPISERGQVEHGFERGTHHVVHGTAGAMNDFNSTWEFPAPEWANVQIAGLNQYGYGRMTITSDKILYEQIGILNTDDWDGDKIIDSFEIVKPQA